MEFASSTGELNARLSELIPAAERVIGPQGMRLVIRQAGLEHHYLQNPTSQFEHLHAGLLDYAAILAALRRYFGRGARGTLLRIGRELFKQRVQQNRSRWLVRRLRIRLMPSAKRAAAVLDLLVDEIALGSGKVLLAGDRAVFVDQSSYRTIGHQETIPICWTAVGELSVALLWGTRQEWEVTEILCRAAGEEQCRFEMRYIC